MTGGAAWLGRPVAVAGLVAAGTLVCGFLQVMAYEGLGRTYPWVVRDADGRYGLALPPAQGPHFTEVSGEHRPTGRRLGAVSSPSSPGLRTVWSVRENTAGDAPARGPAYRSGGALWERIASDARSRWVLFNRLDGTVEIWDAGAPEAGGARRRAGKPPDGRPFSPGTRTVGPATVGARELLLADPSDGLWLLDIDAPEAGFRPAPLPGGDRFVEDVTRFVHRAARLAKVPDAGVPILRAARGERGFYLWNRSVWKAVDEPLRAAIESTPRPEISPADPLAFTVSIVERGSVVFRHDFAPRTAAERALAGLLALGSLLRPPALQIATALSDRPPASRVTLLHRERPGDWADALLLGGKRRHLLVANILLAGALAALAFRRMRRFGARPARCWIWAAAVAVGGVFAYAGHRACEPRRAWRPLAAAPASPPLIAEARRAPAPAGA